MYRDSSVKAPPVDEFAQLGARNARAELMVGKRRTLDPKLDIVFWMLFGAERNRELLISLLNVALERPSQIVSAKDSSRISPEESLGSPKRPRSGIAAVVETELDRWLE